MARNGLALFLLTKDQGITWEPDSLVEDLHLNMGTSTRFTGRGIHFRRATGGVSLWGRFEIMDSIFDSWRGLLMNNRDVVEELTR